MAKPPIQTRKGKGQKPKARSLAPPIEVAAGLVFRDGRLLITKRCAEAHLGGFWEFPGGKREKHESFEACLVRELREELGIEVKVGQMLESLTHRYPDKKVHLRFFRCTWLQNEPEPIGCEAVRWITVKQLKKHRFPEADARLLKKLSSSPEIWDSRPYWL